MSYDPPPPYAAPPPLPGQAPKGARPTTVTAAAGLLVGEAVLLLISVIFGLISRDTVQDAVDKYLDAQNVSSTGTGGQTFGSVISTVVSLLFAAAFIALALGVLRGANVARIISWVVSGLALCCVSVGSIGTAVIYADYLPGGYLTVTYLLTFIELAGFIGIIVLLALPASNAYFRKPVAGF
ncbi:hypothetical protein [Cryptosporangium arvum]|uniref:hypothetical protein n=1 Tax=Cryptosporangium arvum TaxID=80871 RepID=UPI0004ACC24F|nr:hypothetical protein [Cryptosporangium arvum]